MSTLQLPRLRQVASTIRVKRASDSPFSESPDGSRLSHGVYTLAYAGPLQGEGQLEELRCFTPGGGSVVYGLERVTCSIEGRSGSFVLQHIGRIEHGVLHSQRTVVPGSGSGGFSGLMGEIDFAALPGMEYPIIFEYCLG